MKSTQVCSILHSIFFVLLFYTISSAADPSTSGQDFVQCLIRSSSTSISKAIYTSQNSTYTSVLKFSINNLRFDTPATPKPIVIVKPEDESQIQTVIYCCKKHDIQMRIRGGGHDYEGLSYVAQVPFVLLDMINLRSINVDPVKATAWVGAGATLGELYYYIGQKSDTLGFPAGIWSTVGLVSVPKIVTVFEVERTLEQNATQVLHRWQTVAPRLPKDVEIRVAANTVWKNMPNEPQKTVQDDGSSGSLEDSKTVSVNFIGQFLGRKEGLLSMMNKRFPELGLEAEACTELTYIQSILTFSLFPADASPTGLLNRTAYKIPFKAKSDFVDKPISREGLEGLWKILLQQEPGRTNFLFTSYGGKMAEISESAIPFPHRAGTLYMMYMRVRTDGDTSNAMKWIRGLYKYLTPYVTSSPRAAYVNYNDLDLGVNNLQGATSYKQASRWGKKYFKDNFNRLVRIKSVVDPDNFFRHEQSIPPFS
ncbi:hypothetical protein ACET3Z_028550 [Daucus carota]